MMRGEAPPGWPRRSPRGGRSSDPRTGAEFHRGPLPAAWGSPLARPAPGGREAPRPARPTWARRAERGRPALSIVRPPARATCRRRRGRAPLRASSASHNPPAHPLRSPAEPGRARAFLPRLPPSRPPAGGAPPPPLPRPLSPSHRAAAAPPPLPAGAADFPLSAGRRRLALP